jgi:hypothetical protein
MPYRSVVAAAGAAATVVGAVVVGAAVVGAAVVYRLGSYGPSMEAVGVDGDWVDVAAIMPAVEDTGYPVGRADDGDVAP